MDTVHLSGADLEIYEWWGYVIFSREIFKTTPTFTSTSPTLPRTSSANVHMHTRHKSRVTASVLALLVAQAMC